MKLDDEDYTILATISFHPVSLLLVFILILTSVGGLAFILTDLACR